MHLYSYRKQSTISKCFKKSASPAVQKKKKSSKKSSEKMQTEVEHQKDNNMTVKQNGFYAYETNSEFNV